MNLKNQFQKNIYRVTSSKKADIQKSNRELENVYNALLFHTIDTLKQLGATDILDIWVIVNLMCQNGCFSYNKNEWNDCLSNNSSKSLEILVKHKLFLNGHGVCRHASVFLQKIYSLLGYESDIISGHLNTTNQKCFDAFFSECSKTTLTSEEMNKKLITKYLRPGIFSKLNYEKNKGYSNHALPRVNFESMTILTDPSTENIFGSILGDICLTISPPSNSVFVINRSTTKNFNDYYEIEPIREYTEYQLDVINSAIIEGLNKAKEAKSTFDTFHKDNLPALEEAENLTKKILKKKY